jgi:hypothetical protein
MNLERDHWSQEYARYEEDFVTTRQKTESDLEPLKMQMQNIDDEIKRVKKLMYGANIKIRENEERIRARLHRFIEHQA